MSRGNDEKAAATGEGSLFPTVTDDSLVTTCDSNGKTMKCYILRNWRFDNERTMGGEAQGLAGWGNTRTRL